MKVEKCFTCQWLRKCQDGMILDSKLDEGGNYATFNSKEALKEHIEKVNNCEVYEQTLTQKILGFLKKTGDGK